MRSSIPTATARCSQRPRDRRVERAVSRLHELVTSGRDPFVAAEALKRLLKIRDADTLRPLLQQLAHGGPFMIAAIANRALDT